MTREAYSIALVDLRHQVASRMMDRSVKGRPVSPDDTRRLLMIGLLLDQGFVYTTKERADIFSVLNKGHV